MVAITYQGCYQVLVAITYQDVHALAHRTTSSLRCRVIRQPWPWRPLFACMLCAHVPSSLLHSSDAALAAATKRAAWLNTRRSSAVARHDPSTSGHDRSTSGHDRSTSDQDRSTADGDQSAPSNNLSDSVTFTSGSIGDDAQAQVLPAGHLCNHGT